MTRPSITLVTSSRVTLSRVGKMAQSNRNYCFTSYAVDDIILPSPPTIKYLVAQLERCPDTQRIHWQGYVELPKTMRIGAVKELFGDSTMHLEKRRGTREEARAYCMKEETRCKYNGAYWTIENGDFGLTGQGKARPLYEATVMIKEGKSMAEVADKLPSTFVVFNRGLTAYQAVIAPKSIRRTVHVTLFYGDSGKYILI